MYAENVEYIKSSSFTFEFEYGFCAGRLPLGLQPGNFNILTKGDRNLRWELNILSDRTSPFRLPSFTCHPISLDYIWTMKEIIDQRVLSWEDGGKTGPFLTVIHMADYHDVVARELTCWRVFKSMAASLRSLLPRPVGRRDEPAKKVTPVENDDFIPDYSKYIGLPRAATVMSRRNFATSSTASTSSAGSLIHARQRRNETVGEENLSPPAYTPFCEEPVLTPITIYTTPGQIINVFTSSTAGWTIRV